jgi:hypothetical protein
MILKEDIFKLTTFNSLKILLHWFILFDAFWYQLIIVNKDSF